MPKENPRDGGVNATNRADISPLTAEASARKRARKVFLLGPRPRSGEPGGLAGGNPTAMGRPRGEGVNAEKPHRDSGLCSRATGR